MINIAIIGANGFIGRHLTQRLSEEKDSQLFLFGRSETNSHNNEIPYKKIDFNDELSIARDFASIDVVYYLISETIPATSWLNPLLEVEKNLKPFINFLEVVSTLKVKKIAFVSSAGTVYGTTNGSVSEDSDKKPFSPYGIVKLTMENFLHYYKKKCNIEYDVYRVSNVYGEGQNTGKGLGIINTFLEKIITEKKIKIFGDGEVTRNYIYVKDVAELLCLSLRTINRSDIYNVSSNNTLSINNLVEIIEETIKEDFEIVHEEYRQSDNPFIDLNNSKILNQCPDFNFTDINEGILKTYEALKNSL